MSTTADYLIYYGLSALVFGVIGFAVGDLGAKKNGPLGGVLGALLGPIGLIVVALLPAEAGKPHASNKGKMEMWPYLLGGAVLLAILAGFFLFVVML